MSKRVFSAAENPYYDFPNVVACFSQIKRLRAYNGNLIQAREGSNTQNIAPLGDYLNQSSVTSFVGAGNGFAPIWYNQVGSNNATQTTGGAQPQIVTSGALNKVGLYPTLNFDGNDTFVTDGIASSLSGSNKAQTWHCVINMSVFSVARVMAAISNNTSNASFISLGIAGNGLLQISRRFTAVNQVNLQSSQPINLNQLTLVTYDFDGTNNRLYINGNLEAQLITTTNFSVGFNNFRIGNLRLGASDFNYFLGDIIEFIAHDASQFSAGTIDAEMLNIKKVYGI
jgi:hypothetical protein